VLSDAAPAGGPLLSSVDGVWIEKSLSLQPSFKQIVSSDYKATLASVDFTFKVYIVYLILFPTIYVLFLFYVN